MTLPIASLPHDMDDETAEWNVGLGHEPKVPPTKLPRSAVPRTRVLVSGDRPVNQAATALLLRRQGHHVDVAPDRSAAIEAIRTAPYDLVLMDVVGPVQDGCEIVEFIHSLRELARCTPIIALTTNAAGLDEAAIQAVGMDGILAVPFSLPDLLEILRHHVWIKPFSSASTATSTNPPPIPSILPSRQI